ncbi:hypothetical protein [Stutzerimonas nitrititolerans]|uniref:hypothetical protein n=1 Tax=Stutzerimonas nitrititolerans TaxID=2482751 RepID=UPI0028ABEBB0|nr:hypothetical protein [Stutzerimonas nitrititolerans]
MRKSLVFKKNELYLFLLLFLFSALSFAFLYCVGGDALNYENDFQFFADSGTYLQVSQGTYPGLDINTPLMSVESTYLGPVLVLGLLQDNIYAVCLFNCVVFFFSITYICRVLQVNPLGVSLILLLSPLTVSTLISINKEIFVFPFLALALSGYYNKSLAQMFLAILCCFLIRWHMFVFYMLVIFIISFRGFLRLDRKFLFALLLLLFSFAYVSLMSFFSGVIDTAHASFEAYEGQGVGIFVHLNTLQERGFYFLVFPIKAVQLLFATGIKSFLEGRIFSMVDIYNYTFVALHCIVSLVVFLMVLWRRKASLNNDLFFFSLLFVLFFTLSPVFAARYYYLVYVVWVLVLMGAPAKIPRID